MGYKTSSTRRATATSTVSSQAVIVNSGNAAPVGTAPSFIAVGSTIAANTSISLGVTTVGQTSSATVTTVSAGPTIANVAYLDTNNAVISGDVAVSTAGGNILITGSGFVANSNVYVNNTLVSNTFLSSTQIRAICPAASAGYTSLMIFTPTNVGTINPVGVRYSGVPTWTTAAVGFQNATAANVALVATSDSTLTYTLQSGSTLPTGISLNSAGYLAGTATGYSTNTSSTVVIVATDLEGQSTQQTLNITVSVADAQFPYTTLLLNGETSVTPFIADASTNSFPLTIAGDTRADKFTPYRGDGYYSNYFNGSSDYLGTTITAQALGTGDFTIEGWAYATGTITNNGIFHLSNSLLPSSVTGLAFAWFTSGGGWQLYYGGTSQAASATVLTNTWYHFALVRISGQLKVYVNGQLTNSVGDSTNYTQTSLTLGGYYSTSQLMAGYISNFRIIKGTGLYTSAFTPSTTPLTAISGTSLLTCQSNRFIDNSTNAFTVTPTGAPKISPAIPFAANSSYVTYGSQYSPTTASYSTVSMGATQAFGTGDFTVECWVYNTATAHNLSMAATTTNTWELLTYGSQLYWHENGGNLGGAGYGTIALNTWSHFAVSRASGTLKMFINGVQVYSAANIYNYSNNSTARSIGPNNGGTAGQYISDFRVINGTGLYTSAFTPPTAPLTPVANTQLLTLQYNGGGNNYGIIDNGPFNNVITRAGNATQGTFSPYSQTGWSNYFNGTSAYLTTPSTTIAFGTGDFTVEGWFYFTGTDGTRYDLLANNSGFLLYRFTDNALSFYTDASGTNKITVTGFTAAAYGNKWTHIAITRQSGSTKLFLNGVQAGSTFTSDTTNYTGTTLYIGRNGSAAIYYSGYISNFRVVVGTALYTSAFTPSTTPLTAVANTQLLTCQSNRFIDTSTNTFTVTTTGSPSVQAFSPFSPSAAYTPSLHGGSAYFDGTGDYLTITDNPPLEAGAATVTIECWIYPTAAVTGGIIAKRTDTSAAYGSIQLTRNSAGTLVLLVSYTGSSWAVNSSAVGNTPINQWSHVAVTKNSSSVWQIWINGTAVYTSSAQVGSVVDNTTAWTIGCMATDLTSPFTGYISDFRYVIGSAVYTSTFTPPTSALTVLNSTALLLNFTNGGIVDAHSSNVLETVGGAQLSTAVKKFGNASMYFGGSGAYCYASTNALYAFGTGDFTIEAWIYRLDTGVQRAIVDTRGAAAVGVLFYITTNNVLNAFDSTSVYISSTGTVPANQWVHVAMTRNGTNTKLFINGTVDGSITNDTRNYTNGAGGLLVGRQFGSTSNDWNGYLDDLRITKGFARYTANFTAPTTGFLGQ